MLKPSEIERHDLKKGLGYKKKEVDDFLHKISDSYEKLYNENIDLKDKLSVLNDGLQYYKSIEKTLQKALVLAQKTSDDNHAEALKRARTIEVEAHVKAEKIVSDARKELKDLKSKAAELIIKFDAYKGQIRALTKSQLELMDNEAYNLYIKDIKNSFFEPKNEESQLEEFKETANLMPYDDRVKTFEEETETVESFLEEDDLLPIEDRVEEEQLASEPEEELSAFNEDKEEVLEEEDV